MSLRTSQIKDLLTAHANEPLENTGPVCDVVYALFLEPRAEADPRWSTVECAIDTAVRAFQPHPALAHCELLIPPLPSDEGLRTQFATYFGSQSAWQTDKTDGYDYYLRENAGRWRAVPVFERRAAERLRWECDVELGVHYSLARYLSAVPPGRWVADWVPDARRSPAHCATLTARVLKNSGVYKPMHTSAWYGPTTLYHELTQQAASKGAYMGADNWSGMPLQTAQHVDALLRGVMEPATVRDQGDSGCLSAVHALTMRACNALLKSDAVAQRTTQQQLATALLRWTILRDEKSDPK